MATSVVESTSKFHIYSSFNLSMDDVNSLSLLYAPLIGADAFTLYMGLHSFIERNNLKSESLTHQDLFELYTLKPVDFMKSRNKLEGIGLLITYEKNGEYIYVLLPPLSPKNFIKDAIYGIYLYSKVKKNTFYFIKKHFEIEKPECEGFQNITKSFDEVYTSKINNDATLEKFSYILGKNPSNYLSIKNATFDFDAFVKEINVDFLETGVNKTFEDQITKLAFVYNFNEHQMASLYMDSINKNNVFDYRILKKKANTMFVYLRNMDAPQLQNLDEVPETSMDLTQYLETSSPSVILHDCVPNYEPKYLETINEIYAAVHLPRGVINCMIIKTLKDKGGELPGAPYFKRVADTWISEGILSTKDAILYITSPKDSKGKKKDTDFTSQSKTEIVWEEL